MKRSFDTDCSLPSIAPLFLGVLSWVSSIALLGEPFDYHTVRGRQATHHAAQERYEAESDLSVKGRGRPQNMSAFGPGWSGDSHYLWLGEIGESMKASFYVETPGQYETSIRLTKAADYGAFQIHLDGDTVIPHIDLYSQKVELTPTIDLGTFPLDEGDHHLTLTLVGAHPDAKIVRGKNYLLGVDFLHLHNTRTTPPENTPEDKIEAPIPAPQQVSQLPPLSFAESKALLREHCYRCHGGEKTKGNVDLKRLSTEADFRARLELSSQIADALQFHNMPPDDEPQLKEGPHRELTNYFQKLVDETLASSSAASPVTMRRLNRYEYNNAVRDLLQLKGDIYPLPEKVIRESKPYYNPASGHFPRTVTAGNRTLGKNIIEKPILTGVVPFAMDLQAEHGFNNRGAELSVSPILLESFLSLSQSLVNSPEFDDYTKLYDSFFARPSASSREVLIHAAAERLGPFLERAFRRPLEPAVLDRYVNYFERSLERTGSFERSMKAVTAGVLASPRFLFVGEHADDQNNTAPLSPYELATRLSFFLWSTLPDDRLLSLARSGSLLETNTLRSEVARLLESPRSQALSLDFARQWLRLDQLITAVPDFDRFERYYSRIGCEQWKFGLQTMLEPLLLFESIVVEDRSVMLLIDSNYSYRTDEMQSWYSDELPFDDKQNRDRFNTFSQAFRRRNLSTRREGGVITSTAVLTMTSSPLRTSPINRGAWVASVIFNQPPPPPPDVVPEIEADDDAIESQGMTLRQRLVQHQSNKSCASCHSKIDPMGFALENYDAIGRWRDNYRSGLPIDASGELFGEARFTDIVGLKDAILKNPEWFMRGFSEHLLAYALGRKLEVTDKPAIDRILRKAMAARGQFSTIVTEIVTSYPFRYKTKATSP